MKPIKFFKSEKDHFSENIFRNIDRKPSKFKYINFALSFSLIVAGGTNQLNGVQ